MEPTALTLAADGLELAALAWGPEDGIPVLGLHGWMDNAATWSQLAPLLDGVRLVSLELPGHGHSEHRGIDAHYHFLDWIPATVDAIDSLGWDSCTMMGHSMGGSVALLTAAAAPERVRAVVSVESLGPYTTPASESGDLLRRALRSRAQADERSPKIYADRATAIERLQRFNTRLSDMAARALVTRGTRSADGGFEFRHDVRLRRTSLVRLTEEHVRDYLRHIEAPVLLIAGDDGWRQPPEVLDPRIAAVSDLRIVECPGHHHLHLDSAEAVAAEVLPFLASQGAR